MADWRRRVGRIVTDSEGQVGGVAVTVNKAGTTTKVTLKANKAGTEAKTNPFDTNAQGIWAFFVDVDTLTSCDYELDIVFSKSGLDFTVMNEMYENHSMIGALTTGQILETDFDATTFLYATVDDTPEPKTPTEVMAILSGQATAAFDLNGQDLTNLGVIFLTEQATAEADIADKGQIWVKAGAPNTLWFTDDAGTDRQIIYAGGAFHDGFSDMAANEHIDHTNITIATGNGLSGGGNISANRTFSVGPGTGIVVSSTTVGVTGVLEDLFALTAPASDGQFIVATGAGAFAYESGATARASLGLTIGTHVQAWDAELSALAGLTFADDQIIIGTGAGTVGMISCTAFAQTILDDVDAATALATLGAAALGVNTDITGLTGLNTQNAIQISPFNTGVGQTGEIRFLELAAGGTHYVGFKAPDALAGNLVFILPTTDSTGTQALVSDGSLALSWATITGDVAKVGTPVNDQVGVWTGDGTIEGTADLTFASNQLVVKKDAIVVTQGDYGLLLQNTTAALVGTQVQYSPPLRQRGTAWDVDGSVSNTVDFRQFVRPIAGNTVTGALDFQASIEGGAYSCVMSIQTAENLTNLPFDPIGSLYAKILTAQGQSAGRFNLYTNNDNAGNRNWVFAAGHSAYGDFIIRQSNAVEGEPWGGTGTTVLGFSAAKHNVGIGAVTYDGTAERCLTLINGVAPAAHTDNQIYLYSLDASGGVATLGLYTEEAVSSGAPTLSHKVKIWWNGTAYYLGLDEV